MDFMVVPTSQDMRQLRVPLIVGTCARGGCGTRRPVRRIPAAMYGACTAPAGDRSACTMSITLKMSRAFLVALCLLPIAASTAVAGGDARRADATASVTLDGAVIRNPRTVEVHVGGTVQTATDRTG